jgi:MFS family permease
MEMEIEESMEISDISKPGMFRAFRHRNFTLYFFGQTTSLIGTWSQTVAISWLVWKLTGDSFWLGFVSFAIQIPMLIFGLMGGAMADRMDRLNTLKVTQVLCMFQAAAMAALTLTGVIELWHIIALAFFLGTVYSLEFPMRQAFVMDMVGKRDLLNAVSLSTAMFHSTRIIGPVVAGFVVGLAGEGTCFALNTATFLALIIALFTINRDGLITQHAKKEPFWESIRVGLRYMVKESEVKLALSIAMIVSIAGFPYVALMPIFADKVYGGGALQLGWLMGASAIGAFVGALLLARLRTTDGLLLLCTKGLCLFGVALLIFSRLQNIWSAMAALVVVGFSLTLVFSSINTLLQHTAPDHLRGRMMSMFTIAFLGMAPFGSLFGGISAKWIGAQNTIAVGAIVCCIYGIIAWLRAQKMCKSHDYRT